eukprot:NODE_10762_length_277_cov_30.649123_g8993_i0.p2 GENE.NODE_10762_length_277_cov_30.649123_g8993_i0~~NODE_10762_length_277_cov_30.649123_g8993_i0.p2  ORF type:complete len:91 (-),score=14.50 NODE_10762_length_277_cov_30.649123_g8993_i0:5-277(-)
MQRPAHNHRRRGKKKTGQPNDQQTKKKGGGSAARRWKKMDVSRVLNSPLRQLAAATVQPGLRLGRILCKLQLVVKLKVVHTQIVDPCTLR